MNEFIKYAEPVVQCFDLFTLIHRKMHIVLHCLRFRESLFSHHITILRIKLKQIMIGAHHYVPNTTKVVDKDSPHHS